MRRRMLLPAVALLALATAACGDPNSPTAPSQSPPTGSVEVAETTAPEPNGTEPSTPPTTGPATTDSVPTEPDPTEPDPTETAAPTDSDAPAPSTDDDAADPATTDDLPDMVPPDERSGATGDAAVVGEVPDEFLEPVLADASQRSGAAVDDLVVRRAQAMQWNDGSLGCAQPGEISTQAIVDGYWVEIDGAGSPLDYRLDRRGGFRLCESSASSAPSEPPTT